jgi:hypothetical protein
MMNRRCAAVALVMAVTPSVFSAQGASGAESQRGLVVEPAECLEVPPGAVAVQMSGTTNNHQPLRPNNPDFPAAFCASLAANQPSGSLGPVRGYLTSDATMTGTVIGEAAMHAEACLFAPPPTASSATPTVVPAMVFTTSDGDTLRVVARGTRKTDSPPPPGSEDSGTAVITGGTGRFSGASGALNLSAKSHGELLPGTNVATKRDIDLCGYVNLRNEE